MNKTKIEWCDSTWNPVTGCHHDCPYCYAKKIANRFGGGRERGGSHDLLYPVRDFKTNFGEPPQEAKVLPYPFGFDPTLHRHRLEKPKKWVRPKNIFVCSMADLFGEWVPDEWIEEVFAVCEAAPQHRYLFLTKNPSRYCKLHDAGKLPKSRFVGKESRRMWYGTTVTQNHQPIWDGSINFNTFISIEPLLEELEIDSEGFAFGVANWIIIGAETGNRKGKVTPKAEWVERIVRAADNRGIPVFMKGNLIPIMGEENMRREFPWHEVA